MNPTQNNEITFSGLGNPEPLMQTPPAQQPVEPLAQFIALTPQENQKTTDLTNTAETSVQDYTNALFGGSSQEMMTLNEQEKAGVPQLQTELTDITNQIMKTDLEFRRQREEIMNRPGLTMAQAQAELAQAQRRQASQLADLEIIRSARSNTLSNAQSIIQQKVNAQFAEQERNINGLKFLAERAEGKLKTQLEAVAKKEERAFELAKDEYTRFTNTQLQSVQNAQLAGASNQALVNIMSKKNMAEILSDPSTAKYLVSPKEKMEIQKMGIDIRNSNLEYQKMVNEINQAKSYLEGTTGDTTLDIITASAQYGDKRLTDSQLEKIQQATSALSSMESLQGLLGISPTGPVKGKARQLVSALGGDADAKAINATIQGLIPTVARGIFGEVGVLTDADIANYRKTVPNLTSTEDQNRLVSLVMYDVLSRSVKNTLTTNARNQANVSNFAPVYQDVESRIKKLKSDLGVVEVPPIPETDRVKLESAWSNTNLTPESITNTLNSYIQ